MEFKDEIEKQIAASLEDFGDEHLGVAEEAYFPESLLGKNVNSNSKMKHWGDRLSDIGISIEELNIDDYKLNGIKLTKFPANHYVIIKYGKDAFIYDTDSKWFRYASTHYLYHQGKGESVKIERIPLKQFLENSDEMWLIPKDDPNVEKIKILREDRKQRKQLREKYGRKTPKEVEDGWHPERYDKSGYYINKEEYMERLMAQKAKKLENFNYESLISEIIDKYNRLVDRGFAVIRSIRTIGARRKGSFSPYSSTQDTISEWTKSLAGFQYHLEGIREDLEKYNDYLIKFREGNPVSSYWNSEQKIRTAIGEEMNKLQKIWESRGPEYRGWGENPGADLIEKTQKLVQMVNPATEGVQDLSSITIPKDINEAFESDEADWFNRNGDYADEEDN